MRLDKLVKRTAIAVWIVTFIIWGLTVYAQSPAPGEKSVSLLGPPSSISVVFPNKLSVNAAPPSQASAQIYLYGEQHAVEKILNQEAELWEQHYRKDQMRHLFVEIPYYTAEFLNLWMQSDSDEILDALYDDWDGSAAHNPYIKGFYQKIKRNCPQTVFHGTDVGHQYATTGKRYLEQLSKNGLDGSEQYQLAQKNMEQGKYYYDHADDAYRENKMVENFVYAFDRLNGERIMGIYGAAHTGLESMDSTGTIPCMANQLQKIYGHTILSQDLTWLAKETDPHRIDTLHINGKDYEASYFGKQDLSGFFNDLAAREFWRLENAYEDLRAKPKTGEVLPDSNYPMLIEAGQVFVIDYTKTDGTIERKYYRSDGYIWDGKPSTEAFAMD